MGKWCLLLLWQIGHRVYRSGFYTSYKQTLVLLLLLLLHQSVATTYTNALAHKHTFAHSSVSVQLSPVLKESE